MTFLAVGTREFVMERSDAGMKRMFEMMGHVSNAMVVADTQALLDFVDGEADAGPGVLGAVGYCMSGPFVFAAAAAYPDRFAATASIYGAGLLTDRDEFRMFNRQRVPLVDHYPELGFLAELPRGLVLDGEIVVTREGLPDFQAVMRRQHTRSPLRIASLAKSRPLPIGVVT